ncbi:MULTISPECIES: NAD/NADP octopine/nopaline dehydrogenase family protein [unclassified Rhizobium]|uniref:NAD/NADP octopine/nopaline dehydrogenase family protein n=1 Tax=unclassified Rhizobium TaxID=2613769 RepID=UPI001781DFEF|nr:NAD/NADP octopine/nopaline dehydrogenase family protein [Rhizobium sp. CFBP 13644]MBD8694204.1 NAD/NADP octopine/nopaline dehydrogenase family protein [Rhizobium sp. CFBP 13717]
MSIRVAILGTGNLGCSFAVDLMARGHEVIMWAHEDHRSMFNKIQASGRLENIKESVVQGTFEPETTASIADCVNSAAILLVTVPASGHDEIISALKPYDLSKHMLITVPGTFFSLAARKDGLQAGMILETATSPYGCRLVDDKVFVKSTKRVIQIAAFPPAIRDDQKTAAAAVFPQPLDWRKNVLEIGFMCTNGVGHPPAAILNAGRIESTQGDFHFYREGMTPFVGEITEAVDEERRAVARAYGIAVPSVIEVLNLWYDMNAEKYSTFAHDTVPHNQTKGAPTHMKHRYIIEDIPFLLVPWAEFGKKANIATPNIDALILLASTGNNANYIHDGRNLTALGIQGCSVDEILGIVA